MSVRKLLAPYNEPFRPEMAAYSTATGMSVYDMWQLQARRAALAERYLRRWNDANLDVLLCASIELVLSLADILMYRPHDPICHC